MPDDSSQDRNRVAKGQLVCLISPVPGVTLKRNTPDTFVQQDMQFVNFAEKMDTSSVPASENGPLNTNILSTSLWTQNDTTVRMTC